MALLFSDDFTGTDAANLGDRSGWATLRNSWEIKGNAANPTAVNRPQCVHDAAEADVVVSARLANVAVGSGQWIGVLARASSEDSSVHAMITNDTLALAVRSGSDSTVGSASIPQPVVGDQISLRCEGDQITATFTPISGSPVSVGPYQTSHNQTATRHGVISLLGVVSSGPRLDDFEIRSLEPDELAAGTLTVESIAATSVDLETTAATGGAAPYSYQLQRTGDDGGSPDDGSWTSVGSPQSGLTWTDSGLAPAATTYWYRVVVTDDAEATDTSDPVEAETPSRALVPGTAAFVASGPAVILAEETVAASDGVPSIARQWQRSEDGGSYGDLSGETAATLEDADVATGTAYRYRLKYTDQDAQVEHSNVVGPIYVYEGGAISGGGGVFRRLAKITGA